MGILAVLFSILAWFCLGLGIADLFEAFSPLHYALTWYVWFAFSGLLFLASIAANMGGRRGGGEEF
jgi:hypothetical protein